MLIYLFFLFGFVLLIKGADYLVAGSAAIARRFGISNLVIGLTFVAFGTSAPELVVNIVASFQGKADIGIGNILGSNIANIWLVLGAAALVYPLRAGARTVCKEIPFTLLITLVLAWLANDRLWWPANFPGLTQGDGLLLMVLFGLFLYYTYRIAKEQGPQEAAEGMAETGAPAQGKSIFYLGVMCVAGLVGVSLGAHWVVEGGVAIAKQMGLSEAFIGLTLVAVGTSLPELVTSVVAAMKRQVGIAVGNAVGSNVFNILWVLGLSALIQPLPFSPALNIDVFVVLVATLCLFATMFLGKRHTLERWKGGLFLASYVGYLVYLVWRG